MTTLKGEIVKGLNEALKIARGEPMKGVIVTMTLAKPFRVGGLLFAPGRYKIEALDPIPMSAPPSPPPQKAP